MSFLENFLNLESLVTLAASSILTFYIIKINIKVDIQKIGTIINVTGTNNAVFYNQEDNENSQNFRLLWNVLTFILFVFYIACPHLLNKILTSFAIFSVIISVVGLMSRILIIRFRAIYGLFYVLSTVCSAWIIYNSSAHLVFVGDQAVNIINNFIYIKNEFINPLNDKNIFHKITLLGEPILMWCLSVSSVIGVCVLFLSAGYAAFGFIVVRNFDDSIRYSRNYAILSFFGYILVTNMFLAIHLGNFQYIIDTIIRLVPLI